MNIEIESLYINYKMYILNANSVTFCDVYNYKKYFVFNSRLLFGALEYSLFLFLSVRFFCLFFIAL